MPFAKEVDRSVFLWVLDIGLFYARASAQRTFPCQWTS